MEEFEKKINKYLIFATIIIVCPMVVLVIFMICKKKFDDGMMQSGLLASGLSIISIAITAWTGLNIISFLDRKKLDEIEKKSQKIEETAYELEKKENEIKDQFCNLKKETEIKLSEWQQDSDNIKESVKVSFDNYNMLFLQELLKTSKDAISLYFYGKFIDHFNNVQDQNENVVLLMEIEHVFVEIYSLYKSEIDHHKLLISKANDGLKKIKDYLSSKQPKDLVRQYLDYRIAEFDYYKGYYEHSPKDVYECFMEAINICFDFAKQFDIPLEFNEQKYEEIPDYNCCRKEIACYIAGAIGDSYSNIVLKCKAENSFRTEKEDIIVCAKKAVHYCGCAAKWSKGSPFEREVYFRNLGCAYERLDNINGGNFAHKDEIMENYKHAIKKMHNDISLIEKRKQNIYHTILSYFHKYFKEEFSKLGGGCLKYTSSKRKSVLDNAEEMAEYRDEIKKMISNIKEQGNDVIDVKMLHDYVIIARSGVYHNPHFTLRISLLGLSYTYVIFLIKADNELAKQEFSKPLEYYIAEIEKLISYLDVIGLEDDDYANELRLRYKGIMGI